MFTIHERKIYVKYEYPTKQYSESQNTRIKYRK